MTDRTPAQLVADVGESLFGRFWLERLAERLPLAKRTVERIAAAARSGEDYPTARRVLGDLHRIVTEEREQLDQWLDAIEAARDRYPPPAP